MAPKLQTLIRPVVIRGLLLKERVKTGVTWNPLDPRYHQDPVPFYARLRERDPVHWSELVNAWVLTRYEHIDEVLRDHARYSSDVRKSARGENLPVRQLEEPSMLFLDPPDHTRLRSLVARAFTRSAIESWRLRIEQTVDELLDAAEAEGRFDLIEAIADPLPTNVIAEMLGVPREDYGRFKEWSDLVARTLEPTIRPEEMAPAIRARDELRDYLGGIAEERRRDPREDLISVLVAAEEDGERLSHTELITMLILLLVAGNETTTNLIGNGMLALLRQPDQLEWLRQHPDQIETAIEELLRYDSPVQSDGRGALEDIELEGKHIRTGDQIIMLLGAANRDPRRFTDPDRLDLSRGDKSHLSFGRGIHHCLGAPLARLEGQVAFPRILERLPRLRLVEREPRFKDHVVLRGLRSLPVEV